MNLNNLNIFPKKLFYKILFPTFLSILDHIFWIVLNAIPGAIIIKVIKKRKKILFKLRFSSSKVFYLRNIILSFVQKRSRSNYLFSTCLSRCITAAVCLEILGITTNIQLGINKSKKGELIPHAWLINPEDSTNITSPLYSGVTKKLFSF